MFKKQVDNSNNVVRSVPVVNRENQMKIIDIPSLMHETALFNSVKSAHLPAVGSLRKELLQILDTLKEKPNTYHTNLAKIATLRSLCQKYIKESCPSWSEIYQDCAKDIFLIKALKTLFDKPIKDIESEIYNWTLDLKNNFEFQNKVVQILEEKMEKQSLAHIPFMNKDNGMSSEKKLSVYTNITNLIGKIIKDKWNSWPDDFHQYVTGTLTWNGLDQLVDSTPEERERILLRWESELSDSLTFRREVYKHLRDNPQYKTT